MTKHSTDPQNGGDAAGPETELTRDMGLVTTLAIGVGTMIAAGIFTLSGLAVAYVGSAAIASFLLAAFVAACTALSYCEFASIYPESGEGYLYTRRTFPAPIAYIVGWCLLLGYTSSCAFYIASLSVYFNEFIYHMPFQMGAGLVALVALTLLNIRGTKESGTFQIVVTAGKILLLCWFIIGGLGHVQTDVVIDRFSTDIAKIGSTAALVFVTFFGFSAIAASAGEVKNPTRTIPRAIFISMGVVTVLYSLVVLVIIAADLSEYTEASMGTAAKGFLGPIGGIVIVAGALFSMVSASNASVLAGSRVTLSMSQRGHLPVPLGKINKRTRTPLIALILVGATVGGFSLLLPLEELAHFADCVLLVALTLVNAALIAHRRKFKHLKRPFRVPLVPVLPAVGILANIYLISQIPHLLPVLLALAAIAIGVLFFLVWKGRQVTEDVGVPGASSRVAIEEPALESTAFRVLVPVANPANVDRLVHLAARLAEANDGELIILRVVTVPEQVPIGHAEIELEPERAVVAEARRVVRERFDIPVTTIVRIGHNAARAMLETARERHCNLLIVGWKGYASTGQHLLGEITDTVVRHAQTDIMLVKFAGEGEIRRLLLPTAGGDHARRAEEYAAALTSGEGASLTLCSVLPTDALEEQHESEQARLQEAVERITTDKDNGADRDTKVIQHRSVSDALLEASDDYDAVMVGAAGQSFSTQILFGTIPEEIARRAKVSVIVVKHHDAVKAFVGRVMNE